MGAGVDSQGKPYALTLVRAGDTPIQRHMKIKGAASPYDPGWEMYVEKRSGVKSVHHLRGRRLLLHRGVAQHLKILTQGAYAPVVRRFAPGSIFY